MSKVWQINLNHARRAQDLLAHAMMEERVNIAVVAEPYNGLNKYPRWFKDTTKLAAITWSEKEGKNIRKIKKGNGWVTVKWKDCTIMSVYMSLKMTREQFEKKLEEMEEEIRRENKSKYIIAGDFNAKARLWGSEKECTKGKILCVNL